MYTINKDNKEIPIEDVDIEHLYYLRNRHGSFYPWNKQVAKYNKKWFTILNNEINIRNRKDKINKIISNVRI